MKTPTVNQIEVVGAIARGYVQLPNGSWAPADYAAKLAAAIPTPAPIVLATAFDTVTFQPDGDVGNVTITTKTNYGRTHSHCERITLPRAEARREYRRLLKAGYRPW